MTYKFLFYVAVSFSLICCSVSNRLEGEYRGAANDWKYKLILNSDSSFYYSMKAHLATDSASGIYSIQNGTMLLFKFNYKASDSLLATRMAQSQNISLAEALFANYSNFRADTAIIAGKRVYFKGIFLAKVR